MYYINVANKSERFESVYSFKNSDKEIAERVLAECKKDLDGLGLLSSVSDKEAFRHGLKGAEYDKVVKLLYPAIKRARGR